MRVRWSELIPTRRDLPALAALYVAYSAAAWVGLHWAVTPGAGSPIWPAAGVGLAGLLLGGPQLWPALFAGRLTVAILVHSPPPFWADALVAASAAAGALAPMLIIRRGGGMDLRLGSLRDIALLIGVGGVLGASISALGILPLWAAHAARYRLFEVFENWTSGYVVSVLLITPLVLAASRWRSWDMRGRTLAHFTACLAALAVVAGLVFLTAPFGPVRTWHLFPILVWAALAFSVDGAAVALALVAGIATWAAVQALGPMAEISQTVGGRILVTQQFLAASAITVLVMAAVADERRGKAQIARSERRLREETEALEILNETGATIAADLELESVVQTVTDAGVALTGAKYGAFFYNVIGERGEEYMLFTLAGAPREAFEKFGMPRNTKMFAPTFGGEGVVRSGDIQQDPRYGHSAPHHGQPKGHLPVRSYLAAPVKSRSGEVLGGLFFGHPETDVFAERTERLVEGLASQAAIAIDNARLYQAAQREIVERRRAEAHQRLLINELNHRVKNTLATVQSIAAQTRRSTRDPQESHQAFIERLVALSRAHDVLTQQRWEGADLKAIVTGAVEPFDTGGARFRISGPSVWMEPQPALALAMALHELATNAAKYGALSVSAGRVELSWTVAPDGADGVVVDLTWRETDGPKVVAPTRKGFGSRLLERGLASELNGTVEADYRPDGLVCTIHARLPALDGAEAARAWVAAE